MSVSLLMAVSVNSLIRSGKAYTTLLVWPYAVAPAVAGLLWWFMFNPTIGILPYLLAWFGINWNHRVDSTDALILVVLAASWKQISYNFLFFLAGLQSIPHSLIEAAAIDGAGPFKRFRTIVFPLLSPTTFFLLVVNVVYAMFDTFARHPRDDRRRAVGFDHDHGLQGLCRRSARPEPRFLRRAVSRADGDRRNPHRHPVPLDRTARSILRSPWSRTGLSSPS